MKEKRLLSLLAVLLCAFRPAPAQPNTVAIRPAAGTEGKTLDMPTTVLDRKIYPETFLGGWEGNRLRYFDRPSGAWKTMKVETWTEEDPPVEERGLPAGIPEDAAPVESHGNYAYCKDRSLFYTDCSGRTRLIARSTDRNITYGKSVSRNEFGINGGIFWSPDGQSLAFYRKDESRVTDFPLLDIATRTGRLKSIKYPMNGMDSERVSLGIYHLADSTTVYAEASDFGEDRYLTNISWSPDSRHLFIQVLDRSQKRMHLNSYNAGDGRFERRILQEEDSRFVEPLDPIWFLKGTGLFIYKTDARDGYKNLYLCDTEGEVRRLTAVAADVEYLANDGKAVYYTSAEVSPVENHLFRIRLDVPENSRPGQVRIYPPERLTPEEGWHEIEMRPDCRYYLDRYSSFNFPGCCRLKSTEGKPSRTLLLAEDPLKGYAGVEISLGTVRSADGKYDNWYRLCKPAGFNPGKKYPVIVYVYGGPHSQLVQDRWLGNIRMWEVYMAQRGYLVYVQDNRGTLHRGAEFEKAIHRQCGQAEMEDQMAGVEMLRSLPYVDADRIGVHGWSYGGFMTISLMTHYPDVFKVGVAGGPVIDWKWYEIMYGERYMETEKTNPEGFARTSLIGRAKDLKGRLLICQGAMDSTVVWQHSLSFVQECIEQGVQLDYFPYPRSEHNVFGRWRVHLMEKVSEYFERRL